MQLIDDEEVATGFPDWVESVYWVYGYTSQIYQCGSPDQMPGLAYASAQNEDVEPHPWLVLVFQGGLRGIAVSKSTHPVGVPKRNLVEHFPHTHLGNCPKLDKKAQLQCSPDIMPLIYFPQLVSVCGANKLTKILPYELCISERRNTILQVLAAIK